MHFCRHCRQCIRLFSSSSQSEAVLHRWTPCDIRDIAIVWFLLLTTVAGHACSKHRNEPCWQTSVLCSKRWSFNMLWIPESLSCFRSSWSLVVHSASFCLRNKGPHDFGWISPKWSPQLEQWKNIGCLGYIGDDELSSYLMLFGDYI